MEANARRERKDPEPNSNCGKEVKKKHQLNKNERGDALRHRLCSKSKQNQATKRYGQCSISLFATVISGCG